MGLLGKTAYIEGDIVPYFAGGTARSEALELLDRTPIVVKCNNDSFDHAPSKLDVLVSLRNQLVKRGVKTPHFDYGLKSYCEALSVSDWENVLKIRLTMRAYLNDKRIDCSF